MGSIVGTREQRLMTFAALLIGIALGLDLFAGSLSVGIAGLPRERWPRTALIFAFFGVVLLAVGLAAGNLLSDGLGNIASYLAGVALIGLGLKSLVGIFLDDHSEEEAPPLDPKSVMTTGFIAPMDKLAVGISRSLIDISKPPVLLYFAVQGFVLTLLGLALGKRLGSKLGFVAHLLAGAVFVILGAIIIIQTARNHDLH